MPRSLIPRTLASLVVLVLSGCESTDSAATATPTDEVVYAARIASSDPAERYVGLVNGPPKIMGRLGFKKNCLVDTTRDYLVVLPPTMSLVENANLKGRYSLTEKGLADAIDVGERYTAYGFIQTTGTEPFRPLDQAIPTRCRFPGFVFLNPDSLKSR